MIPFLLTALVTTAAPPGMSRIRGGEFPVPFRKDSATLELRVGDFFLDRHAVTTGEFLAFLHENPRYTRSGMRRLFADSGYLQDWPGDLQPPPKALNSPITRISWHAAKEYCACQGKRLPTTAEWEFAARTFAGRDSTTRQQVILNWYSQPKPASPPAIGTGTRHAAGVRDLFGVVWEWTSDFNAYGFTGLNSRDAGVDGVFCGTGSTRVEKDADYATYMRWAFRLSLQPDYTVGTLGFRCARSAVTKEI